MGMSQTFIVIFIITITLLYAYTTKINCSLYKYYYEEGKCSVVFLFPRLL